MHCPCRHPRFFPSAAQNCVPFFVHPIPSARLGTGARVLWLQETMWFCYRLGPGLPLWDGSSQDLFAPNPTPVWGVRWTQLECSCQERNHCIFLPRGNPLETCGSMTPPGVHTSKVHLCGTHHHCSQADSGLQVLA